MMKKTQKTQLILFTTILAVVAGIVYNSWPLGYILNPLVSRRGLASELEALHQPYNWVFILLDIISGAIVIFISLLLWKRYSYKLQRIVILNFALFGLFTAIDALLPMTCDPSITVCPALSHQPLLILHGIASIAASVCLFISVFLVWWQRHRNHKSAVMTIFMLGWTLFGIASIYFFFVPGPGYIAQHYFITLCSLWVVMLPIMVQSMGLRPKLASAAIKR